MTRKPGSTVLSRRTFMRRAGLIAGGVLLGAAGCGRRRREATLPSTSPPTPTTPAPSASTAAPTTPVSTAPRTAPTAVITSPLSSPVASSSPPTTILVNGKVITVDAGDTIAQAVAVQGDSIQAVGTSEQMRKLAGPGTNVIDLGGKAVTPGLIDPHNHFQVTGQMQGFYTAFLPPDVRSVKELQDKLREVIAKTPAGEWVKGYFLGLGEGHLPNRLDLDPVSPNHPVWLMQQGGHYGSANSLGLKMAGITAATRDPQGGVIERDSGGEPTGVFFNHRAMDMLRRVIPAISQAETVDNIISTQAMFAAWGITSFQDNNVRGVDTIRTYLDQGRQGKMYLRGAVYYTLEWPEDLNRALKDLEQYSDPFMRFAGYKFLIDGQVLMAYCHEPHKGMRWDMPTWEPKSFKNAVRALHDAGGQICVHCAGDAAADLVLDAYEEAMKANPRPDPRHRIEHAVFTTPAATGRMKDLGVVVSTQPQFLRLSADYWATIVSPELMHRAIVTREWLDSGVHLAIGSDTPTTPWYNPQVTLAGAVTRATQSNKVHEPDQRMTIQEALRAHTVGAAYAAHEEKIKGSIEPGKLADLAVWADDPYAISPQRLLQTQIVMTIVGGKIVYQT